MYGCMMNERTIEMQNIVFHVLVHGCFTYVTPQRWFKHFTHSFSINAFSEFLHFK